MYDSKNLRQEIRTAISGVLAGAGITGWPVYHMLAKDNEVKFIVFTLDELREADGRHDLELSIHIIGPMSGADSAESVSDALIKGLSGAYYPRDKVGFYLYHESRQTSVERADPHTVRFTNNYSLYVYEREVS